MSTHPQWALKYKRKGTELRCINGKYYLYEVSSKWNKELKKSKKVTGKFLGRITKEDGFIESSKIRLQKQKLKISSISVKENGLSSLITQNFSDYLELLKKHFPQHYKELIALAYCRLGFQSPLKNAEFHYVNSYLAEQMGALNLSGKSLTNFMKELGQDRQKINEFLKEFNSSQDNIIFDGSDIINNSEQIELNKLSKSKTGTFENIINTMFIFSLQKHIPIYYRILAGNIKDIKAFKLSLIESGIKEATVIADKGFYSQENIEALKNEQLKYIIPLKRNNNLIKYELIETKSKFDGYFQFQGRFIWFKSYEQQNNKVIIFFDEQLKINESNDFLSRIEKYPHEYNLDQYLEKEKSFGTITIIHNTDKTAQEVYETYKSRGEIEQMIDVFKNTLEADKSYMRTPQSIETWMLINFIALHWYYKIYHLLVSKNILKKFSVNDLLMFLKEIKKVKINNSWHNVEITKKYQNLINLLDLTIT